jgi:hypothetical protein
MSGIKQLCIAATAALALAAVPALASEATFERSFTVKGRVELSVATGSGNIHLTHGSGNQVHVVGRVKSNWGGSDDQVKEIAANPPIDQTGNIIRIGARHQTCTTSASTMRSRPRRTRIWTPEPALETWTTTAWEKTPS